MTCALPDRIIYPRDLHKKIDNRLKRPHNHRMNYGEYIWQSPQWPEWQYDLAALPDPLSTVSQAQGLLLGRLADIGMILRDQASLLALTEDVVQTSAIEGDILNAVTVRSSVARRLGVDIGALAPADRHVDGVVDMVLDATSNAKAPLTIERLFGWHAALFPTGYSSISRIRVAAWRDDATGPMQVISGPIGREKIHYEAPPATRLPGEVARFLKWLNSDAPHEPALLRAGLGHLWFVTLHPFDDGNGRIARAICDLLLARADGSPQRFYSLSAQIQRERKAYYDILDRTQKGDLNVTVWLQWFLATLLKSVEQAHSTLDQVLFKAKFWQHAASVPMNECQIKVLNRLLDGFEGKLTTSKWAALAKCSQDTALRDITELLQYRILKKSSAAGRSTSYVLSNTD